MNTMSVKISKGYLTYVRLIFNAQKFLRTANVTCLYTTATVEPFDLLAAELLQKQKNKLTVSDFSVRRFMKADGRTIKEVSEMTTEELNETILHLLSKNRDEQITKLVTDCYNSHKLINEDTFKRLVRHYTIAGRPDKIVLLQKYCAKVNPVTYKRNNEFFHYLAKAQCMKGNSEKGLSILKELYINNENRRSFYRIIFRELIHDTVLYRSEASIVIFKRYVLEFSKMWNDHYPLVCLWHICWSSTWFSDQMLADELLETSEELRDIVKEKATSFSIAILANEYNEDAVVRLLQTLLKYGMLMEYAKALQVLFNYKLRIKDIYGCTEIIRNCEALGIQLPSSQQGQYIKMLIHENSNDDKKSTPKVQSRNFKLKF